MPTAVYNKFDNGNEDDNTIEYTQITSHQIWSFYQKQIFQNEACKRFLQTNVLTILQPASWLFPLDLRGLRAKGRSEAGLTGTTD